MILPHIYKSATTLFLYEVTPKMKISMSKIGAGPLIKNVKAFSSRTGNSLLCSLASRDTFAVTLAIY